VQTGGRYQSYFLFLEAFYAEINQHSFVVIQGLKPIYRLLEQDGLFYVAGKEIMGCNIKIIADTKEALH